MAAATSHPELWKPCPVCKELAPTTAADRRACMLCAGGRYVRDCVYQRWVIEGCPSPIASDD